MRGLVLLCLLTQGACFDFSRFEHGLPSTCANFRGLDCWSMEAPKDSWNVYVEPNFPGIPASTSDYDQTRAVASAGSLHLATPSSSNGARRVAQIGRYVLPQNTPLWSRGYLWIDAPPPVAFPVMIFQHENDMTLQHTVTLTPEGKLYLADSALQQQGPDHDLPLHRWVCIELGFDPSPGGWVRARMDEAELGSLTGSGNLPVSAFFAGPFLTAETNFSFGPYELWMDEMAIAASSTPIGCHL
jgi:hypothetical protein